MQSYFSKWLSGPLLVAIMVSTISCGPETPKLKTLPAPEDRVFEKLAAMYPEAAIRWPGYELTKYNQYIIVNGEDGKPQRGYLLNSANLVPPNSTSLLDFETYGLTLYRNDELFTKKEEFTKIGEVLFPGYRYESNFFFSFYHTEALGTIPYLNFKVRDGNWVPLFTSHELFHVFQIENNWDKTRQQFNVAAYPLTEEIVLYHLVLWDLAKRAYTATPQEGTLFLKQYLAIKHNLKFLDPSPDLLLTTMADYQELLEGSARYVEHFAAMNTYFPTINNDPTHGWDDILKGSPTKSQIRNAFSHRMGYHVGAIVTHLLKQRGVDVENQYPSGKTPFLLVSENVLMTTDELTQQLTFLQNSPEWNTYISRATALYTILNN